MTTLPFDARPRPLLRGEVRVATEGAVVVQVVCTCGFVLAWMPAPYSPDEILASPGLDEELYRQARAELPPLGFGCPGCGHSWYDVGEAN